MAQSVTGGWARANVVKTPAPLKPGIDPEHLTPTDVQWETQQPTWVSTVQSPGLPNELLAEPVVEPDPRGNGPVDQDPLDPQIGMGIGAGLSLLDAQDYRMEWHNEDPGTVAARSYQHMTDRDGTPLLVTLDSQQLSGDSPSTLQLKRTGIGQPNDPEATLRQRSRRERRWWDRYIDMHRWDVTETPVRPQYARPVPARDAVPDGDQYTPPFGNRAAFGDQAVITPDRFIVGQVRRAPGDWTGTQATDGTDLTLIGAGEQYGLTVWGQ